MSENKTYLTIEVIGRQLGEVKLHPSAQEAVDHANSLLAEVLGCTVEELPKLANDGMAEVNACGIPTPNLYAETANHDDWDCYIKELKAEENYTLNYFKSFASREV